MEKWMRWRGTRMEFSARPAVLDRDNASSVVLGQRGENGLGEVKVLAGRVAPSTVVAGQVVVGRAEVGGRDEEGRLAKLAPLRVVDALHLVARPTRLPVVEHCRAHRRRLIAVALLHHVLITAGSSYKLQNSLSRLTKLDTEYAITTRFSNLSRKIASPLNFLDSYTT